MDELYDKLGAFIDAFNSSQGKVNELLAEQNRAAAALAELSAAIERFESELDQEADAGEPYEEELPPAEDNDEEPIQLAWAPPEVCCATCVHFAEPDFCTYWQQSPPPEVLAVGCHTWVIHPAMALPPVPEPEEEPEPEPVAAPAKRKPGRPKTAKPEPVAAKPKASRGGAKPGNGLANVPF